VHAAFEEFCESVALYVVDQAIEQWTVRRKISRTLLALLVRHGENLVLKKDDTDVARVFDGVHKALAEAKKAFSMHVHGNHGVSVGYMNTILFPAGLEVPEDAKYISSLSGLVAARGQYAHGMAAKRIPSPEDVKNQADDCLAMCKAIRDQAIAVLRQLSE
jgi:hypothetical protein